MAYKTHYLTDVILRVDYIAPEESLKKRLDTPVRNTCLRYFPILEPHSGETREVMVSNAPGNQNAVVNSEKLVEWHFFGKNREKELVITHNAIFVNFKEYHSFEQLKAEFFAAYEALTADYPEISANRVGLRYINQINLTGDRVVRKSWSTYWNRYIHSTLVQSLSFPDEDGAITRQMTTTEMNYGEYMLRFQHGIFNEDYPAPNKKLIYILDTDIYSVGQYTCDELLRTVDTFHEKAYEWFERMIKDPLRKRMGKDGEDDA